jgi:hypothetical protein
MQIPYPFWASDNPLCHYSASNTTNSKGKALNENPEREGEEGP